MTGNEEYEIISPSQDEGLRPQTRRRQVYDIIYNVRFFIIELGI